VLVGEAHLQTSAMNNRDQIANNLVLFTLNNRLYFDQFPQHKKTNGQWSRVSLAARYSIL